MTKREKPKLSLKDWFFQAFRRPAAKSAGKKAKQTFALPTGDYRKNAGRVERIQPRKFRRGRAWQGGKLVRPERFKFWTLRQR